MFKFRGFTLIELLITIAIIAILSAIALVAYSTVLKQGRDAKRQSDLRSIQSALEQYNSDQGFYPFTAWKSGYNCGLDNILAGDNPSGCGTSFTNWTGGIAGVSVTKTYMNSLPQDPTDPTGSTRYKYEAIPTTPTTCDNSTTKCTSYCLYANLENSSSSQLGSCPSVTGYNFAVTPP